MVQINLLGFLCEAWGQNKKIYKDIDRLYQKRKYEFYKLAKKHELYNHQIITEGSLLQEEYSKKALGILLYQREYPEDEEIISDIDKIVEKGWPYVFTYVVNFNTISFYDFMQRLIKKNKGIENLTDDELNTNLTMLMVMALSMNKNIVKDKFYNDTLLNFQLRMEHYSEDHPSRISLKKATPENIESINNLKKAIFNKIGPVKDYATLLEYLHGRPRYERIAFLFDYERVSSSILYSIEFTEKDIDEILFAYILCTRSTEIDIDDVIDYYVSSIYTRGLIKAYKAVKQHYFKNNKETMYLEMECLERRIQDLSNENRFYQARLKTVEEKLAEAEKKIAKLEAELEKERQKDEELNSLREFMFSLDSEVEYKESSAIDMDKLKQVKAVIIGGHNKWQQRMKELLPNFIFIHTDMLNFDLSVLDDIEYVFFYINYLNHAMYYRVIDYVKGTDIKIRYINRQNEEMVIREIQRGLV